MQPLTFTSIIMALCAVVSAVPVSEDAAVAISVSEAAALESRQTASGCNYLYVYSVPQSIL